MTHTDETTHPRSPAHPAGGVARGVVRWLLVALLAVAGVGHLVAVEAFRAQVPPWMPWPEAVILVSGLVELALAAALAFAHPTTDVLSSAGSWARSSSSSSRATSAST